MESVTNRSFKHVFARWARQRTQLDFLANCFWWFIADLKRRDPNSIPLKEIMFERISDHYVEQVLHTDVAVSYRDPLQLQWLRLIGHVVFRMLTDTFPNSSFKFTENFKAHLNTTINYWMTGEQMQMGAA